MAFIVTLKEKGMGIKGVLLLHRGLGCMVHMINLYYARNTSGNLTDYELWLLPRAGVGEGWVLAGDGCWGSGGQKADEEPEIRRLRARISGLRKSRMED